MEQQVKVVKLNADGTAQVIHLRQSACSGDCHKCSGCGAVQEKLLLTAANPIGARPGDSVIVSSDSAPVLAAAAVLYMVPLVLFFIGYLLGMVLWETGGLAGGIAFALGVGIAVLYDRFMAKKRKTVYTITRFAPKSVDLEK